MRCVGGFTRGRGSASTCNTFPKANGRRRRRSIQTKHPALSSGSAKDLLELVRGRDLELIVAAVCRLFVGTPALKDGGVTETRSLHVVVLDLADALDPQRLPREILAGAPTALPARHPGHLARVELGPFAPRMAFEGADAQRRELLDQLAPLLHRERGRHADVMQRAFRAVQPEQQRSNERVSPILVPAKTGDDAVGGPRVLDLDHRALAWLVDSQFRLRDHAVETGAFEARKPLDRRAAIVSRRGQMDRRPGLRQHALETGAKLREQPL